MAQPEPPSQPSPPSAPGIDIGGLVNGIVNGLLDGLRTMVQDWAAGLPEVMLGGVRETISRFWHALWGSGANLLATPFALTIDFGPARILGRELTTTVYAITVLAVALLGLRIIWRTLSNKGGALDDAVNGVLFGAFLSGLSTLIVGQAFLLTGLASDAIGRIDYRPAFEPHTLLSIGPDILFGIVTLVVMIIYGWKLMVRAAYRIVLLMILGPFAPVAGILWAIPQTRWVSILYWVTLGGWLAGGFLAIGVISLAVQLGTIGNTSGLLSLIFGVALVQVAHDLMAILPKGAGSMSVGSPFSLITGVTVGSAAVGAAAGIAGAGAVGGATAGALPAGDASGYGYD
jgi:hypothetical protein